MVYMAKVFNERDNSMNAYELMDSKIVGAGEASARVRQWQANGEKVVFTNGCFDLIHRGHIDYLSKASALGDRLVIGLNSDASVYRLKGSPRPLQDEVSRSLILSALFFTDLVVLFEEDTPEKLIGQLIPDILVKGSDYKAEEIVGYDTVMRHGGRVVTLEFLEGYSTTLIERKIKSS